LVFAGHALHVPEHGPRWGRERSATPGYQRTTAVSRRPGQSRCQPIAAGPGTALPALLRQRFGVRVPGGAPQPRRSGPMCYSTLVFHRDLPTASCASVGAIALRDRHRSTARPSRDRYEAAMSVKPGTVWSVMAVDWTWPIGSSGGRSGRWCGWRLEVLLWHLPGQPGACPGSSRSMPWPAWDRAVTSNGMESSGSLTAGTYHGAGPRTMAPAAAPPASAIHRPPPPVHCCTRQPGRTWPRTARHPLLLAAVGQQPPDRVIQHGKDRCGVAWSTGPDAHRRPRTGLGKMGIRHDGGKPRQAKMRRGHQAHRTARL
jgi:hypothetical protein